MLEIAGMLLILLWMMLTIFSYVSSVETMVLMAFLLFVLVARILKNERVI